LAAPGISVEVADVDAVHATAVERGFEIVYPLRDEEWGVRRFMLREPSGTVVNVLSHRLAERSAGVMPRTEAGVWRSVAETARVGRRATAFALVRSGVVSPSSGGCPRSRTCGGGCALVNQLLSPIRMAVTVAIALAARGVPRGRESWNFTAIAR
jgi:hypothetical protein